MSTIWILIIFNGWGGPAHHVEFNSLGTCQQAKAVVASTDDHLDRRPIAVCVKK